MITAKDIAAELKPAIKASIKEAISAHLAHYDSLSLLPEVMTLKEASDATGISISTLRNYQQKGLLELKRTGSGRGRLKVLKGDLLKLLNSVK